ncbi:hypothetical protein BDBG_17976 [Blastomyces gilchristii SLH14081]|uniref:Uncharacterized protein n=2 Tax=Blastomyces TaxID=229219 RepID=A0A179V676_BLAGS|nr:uncharacterized protein BDBG_17976 [Blastomyces gilchristii SLH14081]KMW68810.1 hypothetical protein BDDG_13046 [Blastomyces dermatitidis ATCC 18188]OAT14162.1 hypothetical protein BDBG_17976 [Blastomyces gilchristii SLH14081]
MKRQEAKKKKNEEKAEKKKVFFKPSIFGRAGEARFDFPSKLRSAQLLVNSPRNRSKEGPTPEQSRNEHGHINNNQTHSLLLRTIMTELPSISSHYEYCSASIPSSPLTVT